MAGDRVLDGAYPSSEGELRPSEAYDFMSPSRPGPLLAIPKWLQSPGDELEAVTGPQRCRAGMADMRDKSWASLA